MKKRALLISLICLMVIVTLVACGQQNANEASPADSVSQTESETPEESGEGTYTIATINKMDGIPWFTRTEMDVSEFAGEHPNVSTFIQGPSKVDAALQSQMIEDVIAQNVDAICVTPFQSEPLEPVLAKARERGIVVVSHEAAEQENVDFDIEPFNNRILGNT